LGLSEIKIGVKQRKLVNCVHVLRAVDNR